MTASIHRIAVYCGANAGNDPHFIREAKRFGEQMAQHHIELVYGGGKYGMMGAVANAVLDNGGQVHGVITQELADRGTALERLSDLQIVPNMDIRKQKMMNLADGMVALPGGYGTLEEISEAISWTTIGDNHKPAAFYNYEGFYDPLHNMLRHMYYKGFAEKSFLDAIYFANHFDELIDFMTHYQAPAHRQYKKTH